MGVECCAANSNLPPRRADPHAEGKNPVGEPPPRSAVFRMDPPPPQPPLCISPLPIGDSRRTRTLGVRGGPPRRGFWRSISGRSRVDFGSISGRSRVCTSESAPATGPRGRARALLWPAREGAMMSVLSAGWPFRVGESFGRVRVGGLGAGAAATRARTVHVLAVALSCLKFIPCRNPPSLLRSVHCTRRVLR